MHAVSTLFFHYYVFQTIALGAVISFAILPVGFASLDFFDALRLLMVPERHHKRTYEPHHDFAILVPIYNNIKYLRNAWFLAQYHDQVVICTTTHETYEFYKSLDALCGKYGFRQHRSDTPINTNVGSKAHNPWKIYTHAFTHAFEAGAGTEGVRKSALFEAGSKLAYKYCILLDGDTVCDGSLEDVMGEFVARGLDLSSVRIVPSKTDTLMQRIQAVEYRIAMDTRHNYPWLTSGACMFARTEVIKTAFKNHSHFFQGGDIEIGKLSRLLGYKVGHLDTTFLTDVPATYKSWFKQRVAWAGGDFRHSVINSHAYSWRHPLFFFYTTFVVYALMPFRLWFAVTQPLILPIVLAAYWLLLGICMWRYRSRYLLLLPIYGMFQALIVMPAGILHYVYYAYHHQNVGIIRLRQGGRGNILRSVYAHFSQ